MNIKRERISRILTDPLNRPPTPWKDWIDMFQLAAIAKENIDIDLLLNPMDSFSNFSRKCLGGKEYGKVKNAQIP